MNNQIRNGYYADPYVYRNGDDYYLVATSELNRDPVNMKEGYFEISHSRDLVNWSEPKVILDFKDLSWASNNAWAPTLTKYKDHWYFAFSAEQQIGIAVCDTPDGTYRDVIGAPLVEREFMNTQSIDPSLFIDDDGKAYLIWGQRHCLMSEIYLSPEDVHFVGDVRRLCDNFYSQRSIRADHPDNTIYNEGADLLKYNGRYLLTWSVYDFRDYRYNIRYAWADNIWGPYVQPLTEGYDNLMIKRVPDIDATGHGNAVIYKNELYQFYHRMFSPRIGYHRQICCSKIHMIGDRLYVDPEE